MRPSPIFPAEHLLQRFVVRKFPYKFVAVVLLGVATPCFATGALPQAAHPQKSASTDQGAPPKKPRQRVVQDLKGFDLLEPTKTRTQNVMVGASRAPEVLRPFALAPRLGKAFGLHPEFQWVYGGQAKEFEFVLADDSQKELFRSKVSGPVFQYPTSAPALVPGKSYFWTVHPIAGMFAVPSTPTGFLVVSNEQRTEIEKALAAVPAGDEFSVAVARARIFTDFRLWYDAIAAYSDLIARYPNRAEIYEQRAQIYSQLDITKGLAEKDFAQAELLTKKNAPSKPK